MPISATCTLGRDVHILPLPSLVTSAIVPVSATPKLTPVMPMSASRNFWRSVRRAVLHSSSTSSEGRVFSFSAKISDTWRRLL